MEPQFIMGSVINTENGLKILPDMSQTPLKLNYKAPVGVTLAENMRVLLYHSPSGYIIVSVYNN